MNYLINLVAMRRFRFLLLGGLFVSSAVFIQAQPPGFGGPGGPGNQQEIELLDEYDANDDGHLNTEERAKARASLADRAGQRGGRGRGGRGGPGGRRGPGGRGQQVEAKPGPMVSPDDVQTFGEDKKLYDTSIVRTIFLEFENKEDWEAELAEFKPTDVEVPAKMIVDGKTYPNVGVSFRGASSFFSIAPGSKRSLNLSVDFIDDDQRLYGYKSLNLLNCNGDASLMSSYLYHDITSKKIATPKVNFVKVVINGRSWGIYANAQQFNKDFLQENYGSKQGARWKVDGSPRGDGGLRFEGEDTETYRAKYSIKSKDEKKSWDDLIHLCRVLNETPADQLETALEPILDVDGALWFLAADIALINSDGYWTRASDYSIYRNKDGVFHILPHDMNESFRASHGGRGGGGRGGRRGRGFFGFQGGGPEPQDGPERRRPQRPDGVDSEPGEARRGGGFDGRPGREGFGRGGERGGPDGGGPGRGGPGRGGPGAGGPDRGGPDRGGFGGGGAGRGEGGGFDLDPLTGLDSPRFPLRSKLLANENLKRRYLQYVKQIADEYLDWKYLGQKVGAARTLIAAEVKADTRKLMTTEAFTKAAADDGGTIREFCDQRREYLLNLPAIKDLK